MSWLGLEKKVIIVTGGGLGIGRAISEALYAEGARVVIADFNDEAGAKAVSELKAKQGGDALFVKTNIAVPADVKAMVAKAVEAFGTVDILVNNAGINIPRLLVDPAGKEEMNEESWDRVFDINVKGMFLCSQEAGRVMVKNKKGVILNMSSESGLEGSEGQSAYAASKAANQNMTRSWAKELGKHGVRVVGLAPGILEATALRSEAYEKGLAYTRGITVEQLRAGYEKVSIPIGRAGKLSEVADTVAFLISERASYIHGTTVNISGGKSRG
jgi:sorbitol-6-phosphate 2-dehydrogenase